MRKKHCLEHYVRYFEHLDKIREKLDDIEFKSVKGNGGVGAWFFCEFCGVQNNLIENGKLQRNCGECGEHSHIAERLIKYYGKSRQ